MKTLLYIFQFLALGLMATLQISAQTHIGQSIDGEMPEEIAGYAVSLSADGNRLAFGAHRNSVAAYEAGQARVYDWDGTNWVQAGTSISGSIGSSLGFSVHLSDDGQRLAVGAHLDSDSLTRAGKVQMYDWDGNDWVPVGWPIRGRTPDEYCGFTIALSADGNRVAVGVPHNDNNGNNAGQVRIYDWNGTQWVQVGTDIDGEVVGGRAGIFLSLSADGNRIAFGEDFNDENGPLAGQIRMYEWNSMNWVQMGTDINGEAAGDAFGYSISLSADGTRVAAGGHFNDGNGTDSGHTRVYEWDGTDWIQMGTDIDGEAAGDNAGLRVALSDTGDRIAIGALNNDGAGNNFGHVRIYDWDGTNWVHAYTDIEGEGTEEGFGRALAFSADGSRLAIGAFFNDFGGNNTGRVHVFYLPPIVTNATIVHQPNAFSVAPNPTDGQLLVTAHGTPIQIKIFSAIGNLLYINTQPERQLTVDLSDYPKGTYLIQAVFEQKAITRRVIKQ